MNENIEIEEPSVDSQNLELRKSILLAQLLKGPIFADSHQKPWSDLLIYQTTVSDYMQRIGLELFIDETEGYAFLRQKKDEAGEVIPRLISQRNLPFPVSMLCALLRKKLLEQDTADSSSRAVLSNQEVYEMMTLYLPTDSNQAKLQRDINTYLNKVEEMGIIRRIQGRPEHFEIRRIIKALIDATWLNRLDQLLEEYKSYGESGV